MKTKLLKRIIALILIATVVGIPSLIPVSANPEYLFNLDFSGVSNGTYTTAQLIAATGETALTENSGTENRYEVTDGVATIYGTSSSAGKTVIASGTFATPVTSGGLEIVTGIVYKNYEASAAPICPLVLYSATKSSALMTIVRWEDKRFYAKDADGNYIAFYDGESVYNDFTSRSTTQIKTHIYRETASTDWIVKMYDITEGADSSKVILSTTLDKNYYPSITAVGSEYWYDNANQKLTITKQSVKTISLDTLKTQVTLPSANTIRTCDPAFNVAFSSPVNPSTLANITFSAQGGDDMISSIVPAADNKSATIYLNDLVDGTEYTLSVPAIVVDLAGMGVVAASKSITAYESENEIYDLDFSDVTNGSYTTEQIISETGESSLYEGTVPNTFDVEDGLAKIHSPNGESSVVMGIQPESPITRGYVEFTVNFDVADHDHTAAGKDIFRLVGPTGTSRTLITLQRWSGDTTFYTGTGMTFVGDSTAYNSGYTENNIKVIVMRANTTEDWVVRMFDTKSTTPGTPILTTTLPAADFSVISRAEAGFWRSSAESNNTKINLRKFSAKYLSIQGPTLETAVDLEATFNIVVNFSEKIVPSADATYILKRLDGSLETGEAIPVTVSWSQDGKKLTVKPDVYLEEGESYKISLTGMDGTSGVNFNTGLSFTTKAANAVLATAPTLSYKDENDITVGSQESATSVTASISLSNTGGTRNVMAGVAVYNSSGKLVKVATIPFTQSSSSTIPLTVTLTGTTSLAGTTIRTVVAEKLSDGTIIEIR